MHCFGKVTLALALATMTISPVSAATNLIANGSFEKPVVPAGSYVLVTNGERTIPRWTVAGAPGNVAPISGTFTQNGYHFPAKTGAQWLDLTGNSNSATGVQQAVPTTAGTVYDLTFFVGNVSGNIFGATSTVNVYVNRRLAMSAVNSDGGTTQVWKKFTMTITAASSHTLIGFFNGDPSSDNHNGLDGVSLVPHASPASGEPGTEPSLFTQ